MAIPNTFVNGTVADADEVNENFTYVLGNSVGGLGTLFSDIAQNIFNADYIGWDSRLSSTGTPTNDKVFFSTFTTSDASSVSNFEYDATNDYYFIPDWSIDPLYWIIVEADDDSISFDLPTTVSVIKPSAGKWLFVSSEATLILQRARIHEALWFGNSVSRVEDGQIIKFTNVTAVKTSASADVDKRAFYMELFASFPTAACTSTGTFLDTTNNTNCNSWSRLSSNVAKQWEMPSSTVLNSTVGSDEFGTDTSGDDKTNPANCQIQIGVDGGNANWANAIILCEGGMTFADTGGETPTNIDYFTDHSIPLFTLSGSLSTEGVDLGVGELIFQDTAITSVTNAVPVINSTIDPTSSQVISVSADGGSNWTTTTSGGVVEPVAGTALWRRIVITRTDKSKLDKVTEQAVKYNL